jgi:prepilin peptidase CpaA
MHTHDRFVFSIAALVCAVIAAGFDAKTRKIPNFLTGAILISGLLLHFETGGWKELLLSSAAALIAGLVFFLFFLTGGMGGGDVKLMAALAAMTGLENTGYLLLFTALAGGAISVAVVLRRGLLRETFHNFFTLTRHHLRKGLTPHPELNVESPRAVQFPYGIAIAAGSFLTLLIEMQEKLNS